VASSISFTTSVTRRRVEVTRGEDVPEAFWLSLRSEWGSEGRAPSRGIELPIERFLTRLEWLGQACRRYDVGIEWDDLSRELVLAATDEERLLREVLAGAPALTAAEAIDALRGSRFVRALKDFQERDLARMLSLRHGANFSVPGAGKTAVEYAVYEVERLRGRIEQMLVVAPLSAFDAWMTEAVACLDPSPRVERYVDRVPPDTEVLLVNYQRLVVAYEDIVDFVARRPTLVVLDEGHRIKRGWAGEWGSACLSLAFAAERRDVLTGTPAPQAPSDLVALIDYLWPNQAIRVLPSDAFSSVTAPDTPARVANAIRPLFARTTKRELDLPPTSFGVVEVPLDGLHRQIYNALRDQYVGALALSRADRFSFAQLGEIVMYLLEAATNPALLVAGSSAYDPIEFRHPPLPIPPDSTLHDLLAEYPLYETPRKFVELARLLRENAERGRKTLVWSNFVRNLETLRRDLAAFEPAVVHGGIPSEISGGTAATTREDEIRRFRTDQHCLVLLANPAAMSEGVSLHSACHDAIYLDRTFNAGQYLQSVDRIHRLGLPAGVETRITLLLSVGTVDEVVNARVAAKAAALGTMLEDPDLVTMALPEDEDYGPALETDEDLAALFAHLRGVLPG
jgi:superfamily II DNA or RNA helicase